GRQDEGEGTAEPRGHGLQRPLEHQGDRTGQQALHEAGQQHGRRRVRAIGEDGPAAHRQAGEAHVEGAGPGQTGSSRRRHCTDARLRRGLSIGGLGVGGTGGGPDRDLAARAGPADLGAGGAGVRAALPIGALVSVVLPRLKPGGDYRNLQQRTASWWVMAALLIGALLSGWIATTLLFAVISFLALREFLSLAPMSQEDRPLILVAYLTIPLSYGFVLANRYGIYLVFVPVYVFSAVP